MLYWTIFLLSILLISIDNFDFTTNFTASLACISNVGPGLNLVGPYGNFDVFSSFSKFILTIVMIAGRLELLPMLLLFSPRIWKKNIIGVNYNCIVEEMKAEEVFHFLSKQETHKIFCRFCFHSDMPTEPHPA